jgi:hypothetical protein
MSKNIMSMFLTLLSMSLDFCMGRLLLYLRLKTLNPTLVTSDDPRQESCITGGNLKKLLADTDTLYQLSGIALCQIQDSNKRA